MNYVNGLEIPISYHSSLSISYLKVDYEKYEVENSNLFTNFQKVVSGSKIHCDLMCINFKLVFLNYKNKKAVQVELKTLVLKCLQKLFIVGLTLTFIWL